MNGYKTLKKRLLSDKEIKKTYDELAPEFLIIEKLIEKRIQQGISQHQLAQLVGTKQSAISRFESGAYHPTMSFLYKIADALETKLTVTVT